MAESKEIVLEIDFGQTQSRLEIVTRQIEDLTAAQKELKKQFKEGKVSAEDYAVANETYSKGLALLKGEYKTLTAEATKYVTVNASLGDSYNEVAARLAQAQKQYKALSAAQRESAEGKELLKSIADQKQALKDMDATMGDYQRNVGNYPKTMASSFGSAEAVLSKFGASVEDVASKGFGALKDGLATTKANVVSFGRALVATPLGAVLAALTALVAIFDKTAQAIKKNDDAGTALAKLWASFDPILKVISKGFETLAIGIGYVANAVADLIATFSDAAKESQALIVATDNLEERERQYVISQGENNKKISELRAQVAQKDQYTAEQRKKALEDAIKLEQENLQEEIAIARERLRIEQENNKKEADTSDEAKNRETELKRALIDLETNYNNKLREYSSQRVEINNQIIADTKAKNAEAEAEAKASAERIQASADEAARVQMEQKNLEIEIAKQLQDQLVANMAEGYNKQIAQVQLQGEREIEALQAKLDNEKNLTIKAKEDLAMLIDEKQKEIDARVAEIESEKQAEEEQQIYDRNERIREIYAEIEEINRAEDEEKRNVEIEEENARFELEMETLRARLQEKANITVEEEDALNALIEAKTAEHTKKIADMERKAQADKIKRAAQDAQTTLNAFSSVLDSVSGLMKAFGADEEAQAKASKAIALGKIAVETGIAIASGTAQAMSVPFPANIAAIATTVATVLANIASAISAVNGAKFATGGIVGGTSYTGDNIGVRVNSGEMILNKQQQGRLFELANTSLGSAINLPEALANAVAQLPPPVLVYEEFNTFSQRQAQIQEFTNL